jgi:aldehyde:ferredoxin oxidoreductase
MFDRLRVNMTTRQIQREPLPKKYQFLGGRGLTSRILLDEVPPACEPLGAKNKLVFAAGLLAGSKASSADRISIGGKSPLTGGIKEANGGGITALRMAQLGIMALIIEGQPSPEELSYLVIGENGAELHSAAHVQGKNVFAAAKILQEQWGKKIGLALIGSAGEMQLNVAGIANADKDACPARYAARGGLGAVMGSKGLKAVVVLPATKPSMPPLADRELWQQSVKKFHHLLQTLPATAKVFPLYGTAATLEHINALGGLPTRNFRAGQFEKAHEISGQAMFDIIKSRQGEGTTTHACMPGCIVRCSNRYPDANGKVLCEPMEYENNAFLGSNLGIGNFDEIAQLNYLCNDLGVDTIETGAAIAVAMEANLAAFGDFQKAAELLLEVGRGSLIGKVIGQGTAVTAKVLGVKRVPVVKGQAMAAYDARALKANGVTYATSPMGADHTAGNSVYSQINHTDPNGKVAHSRDLQIVVALIDTLGLCQFARPAYNAAAQPIVDMINARYGTSFSNDDLLLLAREVLDTELKFNRLAGFTSQDDRIPEFMYTEALPPTNSVWDVPDEELDSIWQK